MTTQALSTGSSSTRRTLEKINRIVITRREFLSLGKSDRHIQAANNAGDLTRVGHGRFVYTSDWESLSFVEKHLAWAYCAHLSAVQPPVFSHVTAAAILGLPLLKAATDRVHTLQPSDGYGSSAQIKRHRQDFQAEDTQLTGILLHTRASRTLLDIARHCSTEQAIVVGDAVLRQHRITEGASFSLERCRASLLAQLEAYPGTRGKRRARQLIQFLEDSAESPLESLYRLQLGRLGFELKTQVPVRSRSGTFYRMDFELMGHGTFFEADGEMKYTEEQYRDGKSLDALLLREKQREEWVRGTTDRRVLHGGWTDALTVRATASLLRAYGVVPPVDVGAKPRILI